MFPGKIQEQALEERTFPQQTLPGRHSMLFKSILIVLPSYIDQHITVKVHR